MKYFYYVILVFVFAGISLAQEDVYHPELEWRTIQTDHFFVHYHLGAERTAKIVAKIAEEIYEPVTSLYQYKPEGRVSFVIKDYDDYSNGGTYFFDNKIEIWSSALDYDLRGTHNWLRNVISHEYTHMVQIQGALKFGRKIPAFYLQWLQYESERRTDVLYGYPNGIVSYPFSGFVVPVWFAEGVAQYNRKQFGYESWDSHRDMILRMYALEDKLLTWNEMGVFGKTSLGNESSYNAGYSLVTYIAEHYGEDKLREISINLSSFTAVSIDGAIDKAIGKTGEELYTEWKEHLQKDYSDRVAVIKTNPVVGDTIASEGFANFYPTFSPDGKQIAYVSNKGGDYFGTSGLYLYNVADKKEKLLIAGVRSNLSWSQDGVKIFYSKNGKDNPHWSNVSDLYVYDLKEDNETRLTHGLRASTPAVSPDGKKIAFVISNDGTINIYTSDIDGTNFKKLTNYVNGEQVYNPKWSPDGKTIIFDYSVRDGRDIATIPSTGGDITFVLATNADERNAVYTFDGSHIIYSSDPTGIFNLYEYDLTTQTSIQLTNVLGGTFMPTVNTEGKIAFSSYSSSGFKVALLENPKPLENPGQYVQTDNKLSQENDTPTFDWKTLSSYDDTKLPILKDTDYKNTSTGLAFIPLVRVDNYNPKNKGIDIIKLGLYGYSYDVLDRYGFFAGAAMNLKGERDVFFTFDYRDKIPGLYQLGLEPALTLEAFNITRKGNSVTIVLGNDIVSPSISYNMLEFDLALKQKVFTDHLESEIRYAHSRYTATIGEFTFLSSGYLSNAFDNLYFISNNISLNIKYNGILPSRTSEINPIGRKIRIHYEYEFNKFNPTNDYEIINGMLKPLFQKFNFQRMEVGWRESYRLPGWKHTLSANVRGGTIFGPPIKSKNSEGKYGNESFFNYYIGGLAGMKGYTFYSMGGNEYTMVNATYRFPILENIDTRIFQMSFNQLYGAVYGDIGDAWTGGGLKGKKFKRDAGIELRIEAFSYYAFPTRIFLNATYGFDKFNYTIEHTNKVVSYGREWNFHFGVLFGFDLD